MPHLRQPRKVGLILSGTLSVLGLVGLLSDPIPLKRIGLLLASTGAMSAASTLVSSHYGNIELEDLLETEQSKFQSSISAVKQELAIAYEERDNIRAKLDQTIADNSATQSCLTAQTDAAISINQQLQLDIASLNQQLQAKRTNLQELVTAFTERMRGHLEQHIATSLVQLREDVLQKSDRVPKASPVADALSKLASTIAEKIKIYREVVEGVTPDHANPLNDIDEFADIFCQLQQESAALKVRYRNSLNIEERLKLKNCVDRQYAVEQLEKLAKEQDAFRLTEQECAAEIESLLNSIDILRAQLGGLEGERDRLAQEVSRLSAPKRFRRHTDNDLRGNKILDFYRQHELLLEGEDWEEKHGVVTYYLYPIGKACFDAVKKLSNDLQVRLGFLAVPSISVDSGCIKIAVQTATTPEANAETITTPLTRVERTVDQANHLRIVGPSGSGKSTWLDNVIWLGLELWPSANHQVLDPKYPFTQWSNIQPDYKNDECVTQIQVIAEEMKTRFADANAVADAHGNDGPEFSNYLKQLSYELFVIDEAQDLYRRAKKCDRQLGNKKNELANGVRDSLLECLNVGRALKVKGYFITQSAKCSKIGLNEDDFDNCVSIFLGASISYALTKELKDAYAPEKLNVVRREYEQRKSRGQKYLGLVSDLEQDDLYLFELPQPGFYYHRVLQSQTPHAALHGRANEADQSSVGKELEPCVVSSEPLATNPSSLAASADLPTLLAAGTHCPECGHKTASYKNRKPNKSGKVTLNCKNDDCSRRSFQWKVL